MKPGKPLAFAMLQGRPVFALPGNPVAANGLVRAVRAAVASQGDGAGDHWSQVWCSLTGVPWRRSRRLSISTMTEKAMAK